ncbi:trypsin-like peptidase domain-containing protein [Patescibacteria group bacterium]
MTANGRPMVRIRCPLLAFLALMAWGCQEPCPPPCEHDEPSPPPQCRPVDPPRQPLRPPGPQLMDVEDGLAEEERPRFIQWGIASTVRIRVRRYGESHGYEDYYGSAVFIDGSRALTAQHVIDGAADCYATFYRVLDNDVDRVGWTRQEKCRVIRANEDADVALLEIDDPTKLARPMEPDLNWRPKIGATIWRFGTTKRYARGSVSHKGRVVGGNCGSKNRLVQAKLLNWGGDSGGPIVSPQGKLIGLALCSQRDNPVTSFLRIDEAYKALGLKAHAKKRR